MSNWGELGVDVVIQATGKYRTHEACAKHIAAGAKRVILASTPEDADDVPILLRGINDEILTPDVDVISLGSNTSGALAPILRIIDETVGPGSCVLHDRSCLHQPGPSGRCPDLQLPLEPGCR